MSLSIALQGIGYGVMALALQGFTYIAVELPEAPNQTFGGAYANPYQAKKYNRVAKHVRLEGVLTQATISKLEAKAGVALELVTVDTTTKIGNVTVKSGARLAVLRVSSKSSIGTMVAEGKVGISDEELAIILMELL